MVKGLFDTSILVAALVADHPKYCCCLPWLQRVKSGEIIGFVSTHTLAELYSVLTRSPLPQPIKPKLAGKLLKNDRDRLSLTYNPDGGVGLGGINGENLVLENWPVLSSPYLNQDLYSGLLQLDYPGSKWRLEMPLKDRLSESE